MNLLLIETNKGRMIDNGFRHTVFSCGRVNDKPVREVVFSCKFTEVLSHPLHIKDLLADPKNFLASLESE